MASESSGVGRIPFRGKSQPILGQLDGVNCDRQKMKNAHALATREVHLISTFNFSSVEMRHAGAHRSLTFLPHLFFCGGGGGVGVQGEEACLLIATPLSTVGPLLPLPSVIYTSAPPYFQG